MKTFFITALLLMAYFSFACLNEHHVNKFGKETIDKFNIEKSVSFYKQQDIPGTQKYLDELLKEEPHTEQEILETQNSIAVCYIKLNRLDEAEKILTTLLHKHPTDYSVVVNLGTLYELQGKNQQALDYIKKAVAFNPDSHGGSEWFHIKVLEFKVKNIAPDNIINQDILQLKSLHQNPYKIANEIKFQLEERIPFTPAPNLMMAKILQEYGDFLADSVSLTGAYLMYGIAMDYDRDNVLKTHQKQGRIDTLFKKYGEKPPQTGIYYLDRILPVDDEGKIKAGVTILEKGFDYFTEKEKERKEAAQRKQYLLFGGIGLVAILGGLFFYKKKKKSA